jgi:hypothetical protein
MHGVEEQVKTSPPYTGLSEGLVSPFRCTQQFYFAGFSIIIVQICKRLTEDQIGYQLLTVG